MHAVKENKRDVVEMLLADTRSDLSTIDGYERRGGRPGKVDLSTL